MTIVKSEVFSTSGVLPSTESTAYLALSPELLLNLKGASISESQVWKILLHTHCWVPM